MKKIILIFWLAVLPFLSNANAGDTIIVKAFNFYSKGYDSTIVFPKDTVKFAKILMKYTLRCPFKSQCGEWDYLTYTHLYKPTGKMDSNLVKAPFFRADGGTPDTLKFMKTTSYTYKFNTTTKQTDSTANKQIILVFYRDKSKPEKATDTMKVYPTYSRLVYDNTGKLVSTTAISPDSFVVNNFTDVYHRYEVNIRYELARFITPYGNGLSLGNGFTWWYDVSDYRTLLHDTVRITSGNWQELLDLQFIMIKGTPPRDVLAIDNLWNGHPAYGTATSIENFLVPKKFTPIANGKNFRVKMRATGHGFLGNENCAEFCPKTHSILVDGTTRFARKVWRDDCSVNPVYPQGGTWLYSRTNWCPGAPVETYDAELSAYIKGGVETTLDYDVEAYTWNGSGGLPYYAIESQIITYGAPNFTHDAAIDDIISPSNKDIHKRKNPICDGPLIRIQNTGSDTLRDLEITYGITGDSFTTYHWRGNLGFMQMQEVRLGLLNWNATGHEFKVTLSNPNGFKDEYAPNNTQTSYYTPTLSFPNKIIIDVSTNKSPEENSWTLTDQNGNLVASRDFKSLKKLTSYKDTLNLKVGCYQFTLIDSGLNGLSFWADTAQGSGNFRFRKSTGGILKNYNMDFGAQIFQQFSVGAYKDGVEETSFEKASLRVYPNPSNSIINVELNLTKKAKEAMLNLFDVSGRKVFSKTFYGNDFFETAIDVSQYPKGIYVLKVSSAEKSFVEKVVVK
ncbi:MAG: peptide-N-glycosidase F-related protein [Bacteroidetes bacterium]|nr:peptide-N-glycosidase F-related protein [Bacteroidota bacterium]